MSLTEFKIDLSEQFEHLPRAPIVEAVIHWRARAEKKLEPEELLTLLKAKLPEYPSSQRQHELGVDGEIGPVGSSIQHRHVWHGFRFESADKLQVAQFTRNGFVFSRLKPYEDWERFQAEAQRLWQIYCDLAEPSEVQRLGVRFINLITPINLARLSTLLAIPPGSPKSMGLPLLGFMHQSAFEIPGHPLKLNVIQTLQPPSPPAAESFGLIFDLDVFTTHSIELGDVSNHLMEMHWIKNKAFFTFLSKKLVSRYKEQPK